MMNDVSEHDQVSYVDPHNGINNCCDGLRKHLSHMEAAVWIWWSNELRDTPHSAS